MSKVEKIRKEIERLKAETFDNKELSLEEIIAVRNCYNNLLFFIDSLEQPIKRTPAEIEAAMQEVEEKSKLFTEAHKDDVVSNGPISNPLEISRHGDSRIGETLEKAAGNYAFTMSGEDEVLKYYAFIAGAEWQKEQVENDDKEFSKAVKLADAMYYAAQMISTDASHLSKAMKDWWNFKNVELNNKE